MRLEELVIPEDNRILYFERDKEMFGFLSHFSTSPIVLDGEEWPTAEHYYQSRKSSDPAYRQAIREAESPGQVKRLAADPGASRKRARQSWFRKNDQLPRADWNEVKLDIMRTADFAKFTQNPELGQLLMATGDAELVEDARRDAFWGIGEDGTGLSWAGRILMEVRETLRNNAGE